MPEENWGAHGGIPACDLCHSRKVKCDRKDPCKNCTTAKAQCLRNRHKRAPRPKVRTDDKIRALVERLSSLEDTWQTSQAVSAIAPQPAQATTGTATSECASRATSPSCPSKKRKRSNESSPQPATLPTPESDLSHHQASGARILVQEELSYNGRLSASQRKALETAVSFVDQISQFSTPYTDRSSWDRKDAVDIEISHREILHVVTGLQANGPGRAAFQLHVLDHIPQSAFEKIALRVIDGDLDEQTRLQSLVIIHFKAAVISCRRQWQGWQSAELMEHIRKTKVHHTYAALSALDKVSFLASPSLLLMQALITGAMLMQLLGDPNHCWFLTAAASRTAVALGYHNLQLNTAATEADEEILTILAWCCHLDKSISMLICRSPSLPPLPISPSKMIRLDPANHMSTFVSIMMDLAPISEDIIEIALAQAAGRRENDTQRMLMRVHTLRSKMKDIFERMAEARPTTGPMSDLDTAVHWYSLDFKYYSTLTSILRLSPTVTSNPSEREECLRCARKALQAVNDAQKLGYRHGYFNEEYNPYLSWIIISYPLCSFFVVFCNVVGTSCTSDFQLLQDVTEGVSSFSKGNRYVAKLHKLCVMLIDLIRPLVQHSSAGVSAAAAPRGNTQLNTPLGTPVDCSLDTQYSSASGGASACLGGSSVDVGGCNSMCGGDVVNSWNDDMMWQLFQTQPSLDWFNSDMLNTGFELQGTNVDL